MLWVRALFNRVLLNQKQSNHNGHWTKRKKKSLEELQVHTTKLAKARENAGDHVVIGSESCCRKITVKFLFSRIPDTCTAKRKKITDIKSSNEECVFFNFLECDIRYKFFPWWRRNGRMAVWRNQTRWLGNIKKKLWSLITSNVVLLLPQTKVLLFC